MIKGNWARSNFLGVTLLGAKLLYELVCHSLTHSIKGSFLYLIIHNDKRKLGKKQLSRCNVLVCHSLIQRITFSEKKLSVFCEETGRPHIHNRDVGLLSG